ncbi:MAG: AAA family ATPase [Blastocatellia bacterium]|nr:AAA family ATPase [Blastocatellia bacterium]
MQDSVSILREALNSVSRGLVEREALVETVALAAVAGEHVLVIGPPGTAKSEAVRRVARATGGVYFEYLLGRFTEPSEIFGPIDLRKLKEGTVETETFGMLPEAEIAFLDEIFLGSTAILNTLLGILNERVFRRGHTRQTCPLRLCVGAANSLPHDESLAAFADRFLVRAFVDPIPDPRLEELLEGGWQTLQDVALQKASLGILDELATKALQVDLTRMRPVLAHALRVLRSNGITLTDRRAVKVQKLIAAAGILAGRATPTEADLWPLVLAVPTKDEQTLAREILREMLAVTENATLTAAAEEASNGPLVRAARIIKLGSEILTGRPTTGVPADFEAWQLKLEGVAREIDAGFAPEMMPDELAQLRKKIVDALQKD